MKIFKELNLVNNYLFCLTFLGISILSSLLIVITNEVFDDVSLFLLVISILASFIVLILSINLLFQQKIWHKILAIIFIIINLFFVYVGIVNFIELF